VRCFFAAAKSAKGKPRRFCFCGECAPALLAEGIAEAAIQLEYLWDEIARRYDTQILCGYLASDFKGHKFYIFQGICAEHSDIHLEES
jgi:hypothetical protein